jgi:hypothetical protein
MPACLTVSRSQRRHSLFIPRPAGCRRSGCDSAICGRQDNINSI